MYVGWLNDRSRTTRSGRTVSPGLSETQYWIGTRQRLEPVHVVRHGEGVARLPAVTDGDVPGGARPRVRRQDALVRVEHDRVGGVLEAAEDPRLAGVSIDEQAQGVVGMGRYDNGVESLVTCGRGDRHAERVAHDPR